MYSAVKVNGRKLYEYARAGQEVERPETSGDHFIVLKEPVPFPTRINLRVLPSE